MSISIGPAVPADVERIVTLHDEMNDYYGATAAPPPRPVREQRVTRAVFGEPPVIKMLVARVSAGVAGFAAYTYHWPSAGLTYSVFLKELFVSAEHRGRGVGRALLAGLREVALAEGCSRIEWTADSDNQDAQRFYAALGAPVVPKLFYRLPI